MKVCVLLCIGILIWFKINFVSETVLGLLWEFFVLDLFLLRIDVLIQSLLLSLNNILNFYFIDWLILGDLEIMICGPVRSFQCFRHMVNIRRGEHLNGKICKIWAFCHFKLSKKKCFYISWALNNEQAKQAFVQNVE